MSQIVTKQPQITADKITEENNIGDDYTVDNTKHNWATPENVQIANNVEVPEKEYLAYPRSGVQNDSKFIGEIREKESEDDCSLCCLQCCIICKCITDNCELIVDCLELCTACSD